MTDVNDGPINLSRITPEMLLDPRFPPKYKEMLDGLSKPKKQREICVHEAAHAIYFETARAKNVRFNRAEMFYDDKIKDYVGYGATTSYELRDANLEGLTTGQWAFLMVKAHLVGGIAAEVFEGASVLGDETDLENFKNFYDEFKLAQMNPNLTRDMLHDDAIRIIRLELAIPGAKDDIRARAREAKAVLFDPYF
jgi:hypothetical protein